MTAQKAKNDEEIKNIFAGNSDKFLLVIGPCSADYKDAVLDYIHRLREVQEKVKDKIFIVPRIYTNKPRTTGDGYKGMVHQPNPDKEPDMYEGIVAIRDIHMSALKETGFSCADEMLYPDNYRYLSDILSYVAIGARSVENQQHRLAASGLEVPVGMKNPTSGDLSIMMNAITAAHADYNPEVAAHLALLPAGSPEAQEGAKLYAAYMAQVDTERLRQIDEEERKRLEALEIQKLQMQYEYQATVKQMETDAKKAKYSQKDGPGGKLRSFFNGASAFSMVSHVLSRCLFLF
jgi:hypothetical protein